MKQYVHTIVMHFNFKHTNICIVTKSKLIYIRTLPDSLHMCILLPQVGTYSRKSLAGRMFGEFTLFKHLAEKVWQMDRSAKGLLIVTTNLDGFNLMNHRQSNHLSLP